MLSDLVLQIKQNLVKDCSNVSSDRDYIELQSDDHTDKVPENSESIAVRML